MKPESTGEGGVFICGWGIIGSGGVLFWDIEAKCKSAKSRDLLFARIELATFGL